MKNESTRKRKTDSLQDINAKKCDLTIFADFNNLRLICAHPLALKLAKEMKQKKQKKQKNKKSEEADEDDENEEENATISNWFEPFCKEEHFEDMAFSNKLLLLMSILEQTDRIGDKLLLFSQNIASLNSIEYFVKRQTGWKMGEQLFRVDGDTPLKDRDKFRKKFNEESNHTAR